MGHNFGKPGWHFPWIVTLLLLTSCENDPQDVNALTRKVTEVEEGRNIEGIFSQGGRLKALLKAPYMMRVKADTQYVDFPKTIHVDFYDEQDKLQNVVDAKTARYFESLGKVLLKDSVVVRSVAGDTLFCKTLWWEQASETFYTDDSIAIRTPTQNVRGTGLWAKADFSKWTITKTVGTLDFPESPADSSAIKPDSVARPNPPAANR
jgi:LPS export ABC transporter protein LptC